MKSSFKLLILVTLFSAYACQKSGTAFEREDVLSSSRILLTKVTANNPILTTKLLTAIEENVYDQFATRQFEIIKVGDEEIADGLHMYRIAYSISNGQTGSAVLVMEEGNK